MTETLVSGLGEIGRAGWSVFWVPMAVWSLAAGALLGLDNAGFRPSPIVRLALSRAALLSLPAGIVLALLRTVSGFGTLATGSEGIRTLPVATLPALPIVPDAVVDLDAGSPASVLLGICSLAAILAAAGALARLLRTHSAVARLVLDSRDVQDPGMEDLLDRARRGLGMRTPVRVRRSDRQTTPLVYGILRPTILLPADLLDREDRLGMVLYHELAHVRGRDVAFGALERLISALFVCNPLVGILVRRNRALQEMRCDAVVLSEHGAPIRAYAELLWHYADPGRTSGNLAAYSTMAGSPSHLKTRILEMKRRPASFSLREARLSALLGGLVFVLGVFLVGCADSGTADREEETSVQTTEEPAGEVLTTVEEMPDIEGGIIPALAAAIRYPETARAEGAEGRVLVEFVVDTEGAVETASVLQGVREDLDAEAVRAVKSLVFKPGRHEGKAVKVKLVVPIQFRLQ